MTTQTVGRRCCVIIAACFMSTAALMLPVAVASLPDTGDSSAMAAPRIRDLQTQHHDDQGDSSHQR